MERKGKAGNQFQGWYNNGQLVLLDALIRGRAISVKRRNAVIPAFLHGKLSFKQENAEDILTSNVFGLLQYVDPQTGLLPFLARAKTVRQECPLEALISVCSADAVQVDYEFWPRWPSCEPDLLLDIRSDARRYLVAIEAKYLSGKSSVAFGVDDQADDIDEGNDRIELAKVSKDQLAKQWSILVGKAREACAIPVLVYLTAHFGCPKDEIEESILECRKSAPDSPNPTICWLSWRELPRLFRGQSDQRLADIVKLVAKMNLTFFDGFTHETPTARIEWTFQDASWQFAVDYLSAIRNWSFTQ
jgi:hypothetical protein